MTLQLPVDVPASLEAETDDTHDEEGVEFQTSVLVQSDLGMFLGASARISDDGLLVITDERPPIDSAVVLSCVLPESGETVRIDGVVRKWCPEIELAETHDRSGILIDVDPECSHP